MSDPIDNAVPTSIKVGVEDDNLSLNITWKDIGDRTILIPIERHDNYENLRFILDQMFHDILFDRGKK